MSRRRESDTSSPPLDDLQRTCSQKSGEGRRQTRGGILSATELSGGKMACGVAASLEQLKLTLPLPQTDPDSIVSPTCYSKPIISLSIAIAISSFNLKNSW